MGDERTIRALIIAISALAGLAVGGTAAVASAPSAEAPQSASVDLHPSITLMDGRTARILPGRLVWARSGARVPPGQYRLQSGDHALVKPNGEVTLHEE